jgi:hypothetical protein
MLPLANLHSLQELAVRSVSHTFLKPYMPAEVARGLTALTSLVLEGCCVSCLAHLSSCVSLCVLEVGCADGLEEGLGAREWAALRALTGLVDLGLQNARLLTASEECCAAVSKLTRLQSFGAGVWSVGMLPALAHCTRLTQLVGRWQENLNSTADEDGLLMSMHQLPSVVELGATYGCPPFAALPNLVAVEHSGSISAAAFASMPDHCPGLRELRVVGGDVDHTSLPRSEHRHVRIAAVKALSALTGLLRLEFIVASSTELIALVDVAGLSLSKGLQRLKVVVNRAGAMRTSALMHLARLQGLPELELQVSSATAVEVTQDAKTLLSGLSGIRSVCLVGLGSNQIDGVWAAQRELQRSGLSCPKHLTVQGH